MRIRLLLGSTCLRTLGSVFGATLCTILDTGGIEGTADDVVTYTGKILNSAATDENNTVFLKVMTDTGNVSGNFDSVGKTYSGDLTKS